MVDGCLKQRRSINQALFEQRVGFRAFLDMCTVRPEMTLGSETARHHGVHGTLYIWIGCSIWRGHEAHIFVGTGAVLVLYRLYEEEKDRECEAIIEVRIVIFEIRNIMLMLSSFETVSPAPLDIYSDNIQGLLFFRGEKERYCHAPSA